MFEVQDTVVKIKNQFLLYITNKVCLLIKFNCTYKLKSYILTNNNYFLFLEKENYLVSTAIKENLFKLFCLFNQSKRKGYINFFST